MIDHVVHTPGQGVKVMHPRAIYQLPIKSEEEEDFSVAETGYLAISGTEDTATPPVERAGARPNWTPNWVTHGVERS